MDETYNYTEIWTACDEEIEMLDETFKLDKTTDGLSKLIQFTKNRCTTQEFACVQKDLRRSNKFADVFALIESKGPCIAKHMVWAISDLVTLNTNMKERIVHKITIKKQKDVDEVTETYKTQTQDIVDTEIKEQWPTEISDQLDKAIETVDGFLKNPSPNDKNNIVTFQNLISTLEKAKTVNISDKSKIAELEKEIIGQRLQLEEKQESHEKIITQLKELEMELSVKIKENEQLHKQLDENTEKLDETNKKLEENTQKLKENDETLKRNIAQLNENKEMMEKQLNENKEMMEKQLNENKEMMARVESRLGKSKFCHIM